MVMFSWFFMFLEVLYCCLKIWHNIHFLVALLTDFARENLPSAPLRIWRLSQTFSMGIPAPHFLLHLFFSLEYCLIIIPRGRIIWSTIWIRCLQFLLLQEPLIADLAPSHIQYSLLLVKGPQGEWTANCAHVTHSQGPMLTLCCVYSLPIYIQIHITWWSEVHLQWVDEAWPELNLQAGSVPWSQCPRIWGLWDHSTANPLVSVFDLLDGGVVV